MKRWQVNIILFIILFFFLTGTQAGNKIASILLNLNIMILFIYNGYFWNKNRKEKKRLKEIELAKPYYTAMPTKKPD